MVRDLGFAAGRAVVAAHEEVGGPLRISEGTVAGGLMVRDLGYAAGRAVVAAPETRFHRISARRAGAVRSRSKPGDAGVFLLEGGFKFGIRVRLEGGPIVRGLQAFPVWRAKP